MRCRKLTRAVRAADPDAFAERTKAARGERRLGGWDNPETGTSDLVGRNLTDLVDQAHVSEQTDGLSLLISRAVQAMRDALAGMVDSWCRSTGPSPDTHGHPGYRPHLPQCDGWSNTATAPVSSPPAPAAPPDATWIT